MAKDQMTPAKSRGPHSKPGKALEKVVATLERVMAAHTGKATVESPKRIRDKVTKRLREHDVVLTVKQGHHVLVIGIECRDRSRPVGVDQIEAFHTKCRDTSIDQGIIVSPVGFTKPAREKALHYGIRCLDLERVGKFDWLLARQIMVQNVEFQDLNFTCIPETKIDVKPSRFQVLQADAIPVSTTMLELNVRKVLDGIHLPAGASQHRIQLHTPGFRILDLDRQVSHPIVRFDIIVNVLTHVQVSSFDLVSYEEKAGSGLISQTAIAEISTGELQGNLVFSNKASEGTQIAFVLTKPPVPKPIAEGKTTFESPNPSGA